MVIIKRGGISWSAIKAWVNKRIRIKATGNTFVGEDSGKVTTGSYNNFIGYQAGYSNTSGSYNNFMGGKAGYSNTSGAYNNFMGFVAGYSNTSGAYNTFIGSRAGYGCVTGEFNNFIGYKAGYYETGSYKLFIDSIARANEADARVKALIYGIFSAATADQRLSINARLLIREVNEYANNAAAITAGLTTGEVYRSADYLKIVH